MKDGVTDSHAWVIVKRESFPATVLYIFQLIEEYMEKYNVTIIELNIKTETELEILADEESDDIVLKAVINNREILVSDYNYLSAY